MNDAWYVLHAYTDKENTAKHRRCLSADKNRNNNLPNENPNDNNYNVVEIENSEGKFIKLNQFTSRNKPSPLQGLLDKSSKHNTKKDSLKKRSHTPVEYRPKAKQFTFGDNEDYIIDMKKSQNDSRERGSHYLGNLKFEETYDERDMTRRTYKELEVWNSNLRVSEKSGRKSMKNSILNKTIGVPKSERNDENIVIPYDGDVFQTIVISLLIF